MPLSVPGTLTQAIRNFAKSLEGWLTNAMSDFPQRVIQTKVTRSQYSAPPPHERTGSPRHPLMGNWRRCRLEGYWAPRKKAVGPSQKLPAGWVVEEGHPNRVLAEAAALIGEKVWPSLKTKKQERKGEGASSILWNILSRRPDGGIWLTCLQPRGHGLGWWSSKCEALGAGVVAQQ